MSLCESLKMMMFVVVMAILQSGQANAETGPQTVRFYNLSNVRLRAVFNTALYSPGAPILPQTEGQYIVKDPSGLGAKFQFPSLSRNVFVFIQKDANPITPSFFNSTGPFSVGGTPTPIGWPKVEIIAYHPVYFNMLDSNLHRADRLVHVTPFFPTPKDSAIASNSKWWGSGLQSVSAYDTTVPTQEPMFSNATGAFLTDVKPVVETINNVSVMIAPVVIYNLRFVPVKVTRGTLPVTLCKWSFKKQKWICTPDNSLNPGEVGVVWNSNSATGGPSNFWRAPLPQASNANVAKAGEVMFPPIDTAFDNAMKKYNGLQGNTYLGYEPRDPLKGGHLLLLDLDPTSLPETPGRGRYYFYQHFMKRGDMPEKCMPLNFTEQLSRGCWGPDAFNLNP